MLGHSKAGVEGHERHQNHVRQNAKGCEVEQLGIAQVANGAITRNKGGEEGVGVEVDVDHARRQDSGEHDASDCLHLGEVPIPAPAQIAELETMLQWQLDGPLSDATG